MLKQLYIRKLKTYQGQQNEMCELYMQATHHWTKNEKNDNILQKKMKKTKTKIVEKMKKKDISFQ